MQAIAGGLPSDMNFDGAAAFVGTPSAVTYQHQPPPSNAPGSTPSTGINSARPAGFPRGSVMRGIPLPALARGSGMTTVSLGLLPSIMAHARASAQSVNAMEAAIAAAVDPNSRADDTSPASAPPPSTSRLASRTAPATSSASSTSPSTPQPGAGPVGQMVLGPNGSLSYTIQNPPRPPPRSSSSFQSYAAAAAAAANPFASHHDPTASARFLIPADYAGAGFVDFWRNLSGQLSPSTDSASTSNSSPAAQASARSAEVATSTTHDATEQSDQATSSSSLRRRERPEDFLSGVDDRVSSRRRLAAQQSSSAANLGNRLRQELDRLIATGLPETMVATPQVSASASRPVTGATPSSARTQLPSRPAITRSSSNDTRRAQTADSSPTASSPSPSSPSMPSSSTNNSTNNSSSNPSPAYNLGRIGVFISAILRMVDQPREDGSPRTLADVICNDPESPSTPLQELVRNVAESITIRETRSIAEGHPMPMRNIHPVLNAFIRERALHGQQLTESNLDSVAVMFAHGIMNAVHVEEILETLTPSASIQITSADIRRISLDVLREHFRRLIYLVVAAPSGRENNWPTFARDLVLWIRDVVGSWRVAFYGLFPERDQAEAQRVATHVVGSAIHANGRRWVELSNRATNTLVNVLCANIVPRRRGEEQGGLVGGAWPLMATAPRQNVSRSRSCMAPSLLGSTAPPAPLGPAASTANNARAIASTSFSDAPSASASASASSRNAAAGEGLAQSIETDTLSRNLTRRILSMMEPLGVNVGGMEGLAAASIQDAVRAELAALRSSSSATGSSASLDGPTESGTASTAQAGASDTITSSSSDSASVTSPCTTEPEEKSEESEEKMPQEEPKNIRRTRVEDVNDEEDVL
ncbi:hypothetical protein BGZ54_008443 [Gamsiella multidivaricata]|nr:hypothetical protein BGZ54_008443 [Gamsiella multidivaricata]